MQGNPSYDKLERSALLWAVPILREWMANDPIMQFDWSGCEFTDDATAEEVADLVGQEASFKGQRVEVVGARIVPKQEPQVVKLLMRKLRRNEKASRNDKVMPALGDE